MRGARILATVLAITLLGAPASAGTREDPELVDRCGGTAGDDGSYVWVIPESIDLCAGWLETLSGPEDETPQIRVTLQTAAPWEDRPPALLQAWWWSGDCVFTVFVDDATEAEMAQGLQVGCGEAPPPTCTVPEPLALGCRTEGHYRHFELPEGSVVVEGRELAFTLTFDGELAEFADAHAQGTELVGIQAFTSLVVGPVYAYTFGCTSGYGPLDRCDEVNGDWVRTERHYTVGT